MSPARPRAAVLALLALLALAPQPPQGSSAPAEPRPDLEPSRLAAMPAGLEDGDHAAFTVRVTNAGAGDARGFHVDFLVDGESLGQRHVEGLEAGEAIDVVSPLWLAGRGERRVEAVVDALDAVAESDESDNDLTKTFRVSRAAPPPKPDLRPVLLNVSAEARAYEAVTFVAVLRNKGLEDAGPFEVRFFVDGASLSRHGVDLLKAGGEVRLTSDVWYASAGEHRLEVRADVGSQVHEANETNNDLWRDIVVRRTNLTDRPDLAVLDVQLLPPNPAPGETTTFVAHVWNRGPAHAPGSTLGFFVDGEAVGDAQLRGIGQGDLRVVHGPPWNATAGNHTLAVRADLRRAIFEMDETNNRLRRAIFIDPNATSSRAADLVVERLRAVPPDPRPGQGVQFVADVRNTGLPVDVTFQVGFWADGRGVGRALVRIPGGESTATAVSPMRWTSSPGGHRALALVDAGRAVAERDEGNNDRSLELAVPVPPPPVEVDLRVMEVGLALHDAVAGDLVPLNAIVVNAGSQPSGPFRVQFRVDDLPAGTVEVQGLAPREARTVASPPWRVLAGQHRLHAAADTTGAVVEADERNNAATATFEAAGRLAPTATAPPPARTPGPGLPTLALAAAGAALLASRRRERYD